ncbi:MAG: hypothetical protein L0H59_10415 [Tomitella sp.]|nr:hypothetical protein [Tomitella sp.]
MFDRRHSRCLLAGAGAAAALALSAGCGSSGDGAAGSPASSESTTSSGASAPLPGAPTEEAAGSGDDELFDTDAHRLISEALEGKKVVECKATDSADTVTTYINGEDHMRIDSGTGPNAGHVIADGAATYVWSDDQPGGMQVAGKASGAMKSMIKGMGVDVDALRKIADEKGEPIGEGAAIDCTEYDGDTSVFDVPVDREFVSMDDVLSRMPDDLSGAPSGNGGQGGG